MHCPATFRTCKSQHDDKDITQTTLLIIGSKPSVFSTCITDAKLKCRDKNKQNTTRKNLGELLFFLVPELPHQVLHRPPCLAQMVDLQVLGQSAPNAKAQTGSRTKLNRVDAKQRLWQMMANESYNQKRSRRHNVVIPLVHCSHAKDKSLARLEGWQVVAPTYSLVLPILFSNGTSMASTSGTVSMLGSLIGKLILTRMRMLVDSLDILMTFVFGMRPTSSFDWYTIHLVINICTGYYRTPSANLPDAVCFAELSAASNSQQHCIVQRFRW